MLNSMNLPGKFKKVLQDISGSTGLDLLDNSLFQDTKEILTTNKSAAVLETRCFKETPISSRKCSAVICKVLYLLTQGEIFNIKEKSEIFFACTRLFQSSSAHLRRMCYLLIKTLHPSADEAFVVTSSLTKDIASTDDLFRANAFRTLVRIVEPQNAMQLERFLKAAIVDRNPHVASTALLCSLHLCKSSPELVRRWVSEVSGCVSSKHPMVQFHALALLDELKRSDRLALHRVIASLTAKVTKSPMAECLLIRYAVRLLAQPGESPLDGSLLAFVEGSLQHRSEIVSFEAARAFVHLGLKTAKFSNDTLDLSAAITSLQILLTNPKPVIRFAAIRMLYLVSQGNPLLVAKCHVDIEPLITDNCRAVSVLALITLLKSSRDPQIEKLIKQVSNVMVDISESQAVEIIAALRSLCLTYPLKVKLVVQFLANQLRDEGGVMAKTHAVNTLCFLAKEMPDVHEYILFQLCDFIEDCEYQVLSCHVISFLTVEIPKTEQPSRFLRYLYNRVILENANIRAAAVDGLVRIGMQCPQVREDIVTVLDTSLLNDAEDEVRERVRVSIKLLNKDIHTDTDAQSTQIGEDTSTDDDGFDTLMERHLADQEKDLDFSIDALVHTLAFHIAEKQSTEFDVSVLPDEATYQANRARQLAELEEVERAQLLANAGEQTSAQAAAVLNSKTLDYEAEVRALAGEDIKLGRLHHLTEPIYLTECEAEYVVQYVKHIWENANYVSLEVHVKNTIEKQTLDQVELRLGQNYDKSKFNIIAQTFIDTIAFDSEKVLFVLLQRSMDAGAASLAVFSQLHYTLKEDNDFVGFEDVYEMEPVIITPADYVCPSRLSGSDFIKYWGSLGQEQETSVKMSFGHLRGGRVCAADRLISLFNMHKCDIKNEQKRNAEAIYLAGNSAITSELLLIQAMIVDSPQHGILGKVNLRCMDHSLMSAIAEMLRSS